MEILSSIIARHAADDDLSDERIKKEIQGKIVMVTGGGGSIGSALCRKLADVSPSLIVIFDIAENGAYDIEQELKITHPTVKTEVVIGSVRERDRLDLVFRRFSPDIVYHAAAHKHVPLMERSPAEAVKNNVFGTLNTALAAAESGCEKFLLISTDKAVEPTSVMGATKRICEILMYYLNKKFETDFFSVRFGNVIGTNGSVIPLFERQIKSGGPITVTSREITRYLMTVDEAVRLVITAGIIAHGGEIFILDMGKPVKIDDVARELIISHGLVPDEDIKITYTGLRPGEKLYEKLIRNGESVAGCVSERIFVTTSDPFTEYSEDEFRIMLDELKSRADVNSDSIRETIAKIVTDYTYVNA